ncbi:MAG: ribonuclease domain-containing protein [Eubacteriales bacterium]|nr:ribonuclease domain-containing protein [Eubacteriales bacterium]
MKRFLAILTALMLMFGLPALAQEQSMAVQAADYPVAEAGSYTTAEEVAVYLTLFASLPDNFITKRDAQALGWDSWEGNLWQVAPGKSIGGDRFGNYEGSLPDAQGRTWTECDINSDGGYRNGQRLVFSNDGLIFYTKDHYNTFRQVMVAVTPPPENGAEVAPTPAG